LPNLRLDHAHDARGETVLHVEHILELAVVLLGPQMKTGHCVNELRGDSQPSVHMTYAAFDDIPDP
jgi:hypothetical protein